MIMTSAKYELFVCCCPIWAIIRRLNVYHGGLDGRRRGGLLPGKGFRHFTRSRERCTLGGNSSGVFCPPTNIQPMIWYTYSTASLVFWEGAVTALGGDVEEHNVV